MQKFDLEFVRDFINRQSPTTKVYIGCDSYRFKRNVTNEKNGKIEEHWYARFTTVVVVHINGKNGCRVFGLIDTERDFDAKKNKPMMRMMNEVYRSAGMYLKLAEVISKRDIEIHVDINPDAAHGSNVAYKQAIGYIQGVCGVVPTMKPGALAASFCADHFRTYATDEELIAA